MTIARQATLQYTRCLYRPPRTWNLRLRDGQSSGHSTRTAALPHNHGQSTVRKAEESGELAHVKAQAEEPGGMSRRLGQMTEESIEQNSRNTKKAIEEGGFSEELKRQLEARIQDSTFKSQNPAAFAELSMPVRLGIQYPRLYAADGCLV